MENTSIHAAFVSTNSICQGQQATTLWANLLCSGLIINFGHQTFIWDSEASIKAHVHCNIVGFSFHRDSKTVLYSAAGTGKLVSNINQYLTEGPTVIVESRSVPLCNVPPIRFGSMPRDGGGFILSEEEKEEIIKKEPTAAKWIHPYLGAEEFLKNKKRYLNLPEISFMTVRWMTMIDMIRFGTQSIFRTHIRRSESSMEEV